MEEKTFLEAVSDKIWKTAKARFTASRRMTKYYYCSNISMALTSVSIIGINLMVFLGDFENKSNEITVLTIILSVYVLVITLLMAQIRFDGKADNYHSCGCELIELNDHLKIDIIEKRELNHYEKEKIISAYHSIIKKYNLNHSSVDYRRSLIEQSNKEKPNLSQCTIVFNYLEWYFFNWSTLFILIPILIPLISLLLICKK